MLAMKGICLYCRLLLVFLLVFCSSFAFAQNDGPTEVTGNVSIDGPVTVQGTVDVDFDGNSIPPSGTIDKRPQVTGLTGNSQRGTFATDYLLIDPSTYYVPAFFTWSKYDLVTGTSSTDYVYIGGYVGGYTGESVPTGYAYEYSFRPAIIIPNFSLYLLFSDITIASLGVEPSAVFYRWSVLFNGRNYKKLVWETGDYIAAQYKQNFKGEFDFRLLIRQHFADVTYFVQCCINLFYMVFFGLFNIKLVLTW